MTRSETAHLWQIVLAMRRKNYGDAETMARQLLRTTLREHAREDRHNDNLEEAHEQ
jgi:hypothetical protein